MVLCFESRDSDNTGTVNFFGLKEVSSMSRSTQWLSLIGGIIILVYGIAKLVSERDGIPFILGLLIIAFTVSKILRVRGAKGTGEQGKGL